jgi:hypothetical protein
MDVQQLKNPKALIVIGVALVGGLFLASKMRGGNSNNTTTEPQDIISVSPISDSGAESRADELSRKLADLEAKKQQEQENYEQRLKDAAQLSRDERQQLEARLLAERQALASRYDAQIQALKETLDKIKNNTRMPIPLPNPTQPGNNPPNNTKYPGLPNNFTMDCANTYNGLLGDFDSVVAGQKQKNLSTTSIARNMLAIAMAGTPTPLWNRGNWDSASINQRRIRFGLAPLTESQMQQMLQFVRSYPLPQGERTGTYQNLQMMREVFTRYNLPYQCVNRAARR